MLSPAGLGSHRYDFSTPAAVPGQRAPGADCGGIGAAASRAFPFPQAMFPWFGAH
jgi:hypothetical protein